MAATVKRQLKDLLSSAFLKVNLRSDGDMPRGQLITMLANDKQVVDSLQRLYNSVCESCPPDLLKGFKDPMMGHIWHAIKDYSNAGSTGQSAIQNFLGTMFKSEAYKQLKASGKHNERALRSKFGLNPSPEKFRENKPVHAGESYAGQPTPSDTGIRHQTEKAGDALIPSNLSHDQGKGYTDGQAPPDAFMENQSLPKVVSIRDAMSDIASSAPTKDMDYETNIQTHDTKKDQKAMKDHKTQATDGLKTATGNKTGKTDTKKNPNSKKNTYQEPEDPMTSTYSTPGEKKQSRDEAMVEAADSEQNSDKRQVTREGLESINSSVWNLLAGTTTFGAVPGVGEGAVQRNNGITAPSGPSTTPVNQVGFTMGTKPPEKQSGGILSAAGNVVSSVKQAGRRFIAREIDKFVKIPGAGDYVFDKFDEHTDFTNKLKPVDPFASTEEETSAPKMPFSAPQQQPQPQQPASPQASGASPAPLGLPAPSPPPSSTTAAPTKNPRQVRPTKNSVISGPYAYSRWNERFHGEKDGDLYALKSKNVFSRYKGIRNILQDQLVRTYGKDYAAWPRRFQWVVPTKKREHEYGELAAYDSEEFKGRVNTIANALLRAPSFSTDEEFEDLMNDALQSIEKPGFSSPYWLEDGRPGPLFFQSAKAAEEHDRLQSNNMKPTHGRKLNAVDGEDPDRPLSLKEAGDASKTGPVRYSPVSQPGDSKLAFGGGNKESVFNYRIVNGVVKEREQTKALVNKIAEEKNMPVVEVLHNLFNPPGLPADPHRDAAIRIIEDAILDPDARDPLAGARNEIKEWDPKVLDDEVISVDVRGLGGPGTAVVEGNTPPANFQDLNWFQQLADFAQSGKGQDYIRWGLAIKDLAGGFFGQQQQPQDVTQKPAETAPAPTGGAQVASESTTSAGGAPPPLRSGELNPDYLDQIRGKAVPPPRTGYTARYGETTQEADIGNTGDRQRLDLKSNDFPTLRLFFQEGNANVVTQVNESEDAKQTNRDTWTSFNDEMNWEGCMEADNALHMMGVVEEGRRFYGELDLEDVFESQCEQATQETYDRESRTVFKLPERCRLDGDALILDTRGDGNLVPLTADQTDAMFHDVYMPTWAEIPESSPYKQFTAIEGTQLPDSMIDDPDCFASNDAPSLNNINRFIFTTDS